MIDFGISGRKALICGGSSGLGYGCAEALATCGVKLILNSRNEERLQKARNLLLQTNMSVINVALACGFASPSHFSKCYRSHFLTTPYRERGSKVFQ